MPGPAPPWRGSWRLVARQGPPETLVVSSPDPRGARLACLTRPTAAAVVLGSAQPLADFDAERCARQHLDLVRRRSGGGAVVVSPGAQIWLDLFVPAADPLFESDVVRASSWVGSLWREALGGASGDGARLAVHEGGLAATPWSRRVCFSGVGPGEVTRDGRKVTGVAQRRDRAGAWFFTMALVRPEQQQLASLLALGRDERAAIRVALGAETSVIGCPAQDLERQLGSELGGVWSAGEDVPPEPHPPERGHETAGGRGEKSVERASHPREAMTSRHRHDLEPGEHRREGDPGRDRDETVVHRRTR